MGGVVERTVLDGIPVLWVEAPPPYVATLQFRVGFADERLPIRGVTHLVEHLAIFAAGIVRHDHNGWVGPTDTGIWGGGTQEEALAFVTACAQALHALPFDRLDGERRVLRTEAAAGGLNARLYDYRFGAAGLGLSNYDELGLRWLGPDGIAAWAAEHFTAGNVVLALSGPPPDSLQLDLPPGARHPDPVLEPVPPNFPVHVADGHGGVALSLFTSRSTALNAATAILSDRLRDRLRHEAALSYAPYATYDRISQADVHVLLGSDCEDHHARVVQEMLWRTVDEFAEHGPTEEELEHHRRRVDETLADPQFVRADLASAADAELRGEPIRLSEAWRAELDTLDGPAGAAVVREALASAVLLAPNGLSAPADGFGPPRAKEEPLQDGTRYRRAGLRLGQRKESVLLSDEGVTMTRADGSDVTLRAGDLVGGIWFPDDSLSLIARGGAFLQVYPTGWRDGPEIMERMRGLVGAENVVPCAPLEIATRVRELAHASGAASDLDVADALHELPGLLHEEEEAVVVCRARHNHTGLLCVTTARLLWVRIEGTERALVEHAAHEIRDVKRDWVEIGVDIGSETLKFDVGNRLRRVVADAVARLVADGET